MSKTTLKTSTPATEPLGRSTVWLVVLCLLSVALFLGLTPFNTRGEPREAIVAFSMWQDGNWILPINNGDEIAFKPPLLHWLVALLATLTGELNEFTARLPSALAATAMVAATFRFFAHRRNASVAWLTALLTLTNFEVHRAAMTCRVDMLLSALMVMGLYALYRWNEQGLHRVPWVAWLCLAGAALTKGPVGIVLPCGAAAVFYWLQGRRFWPVCWRLFLLAVASLIPLLLWYWLAYHEPHGGQRFLRLIYEENILRFTGQMSYASHINPWYYNVTSVLAGFLPYSLLALFGACCLRWRPVAGGFRSNGRSLLDRLTNGIRTLPATRLFALVCPVVIFVFYCIPASKRSVYLLPLYPFVAYWLAEFFVWLSQRHARAVKAFGWTISVLAFLLTVTFIVVRLDAVPDNLFSGKHAEENMAFVHILRDIPLTFSTVVLTLLPAVAGMWCLRQLKRSSAVWGAVSVVFCVHLALSGFYLPTVLSVKSDRAVARRIASLVPEGRIYSYRTDVLEANRMHPFTINFYLGDRIIPIDKAPTAPSSGYLIAGNDDIETFSLVYPQYAVSLVYDSRHRSCDDHKTTRLYYFTLYP